MKAPVLRLGFFIFLSSFMSCFGGIFSVDVRKITDAEETAFAGASNRGKKCEVVKTAINAFKKRIEQDHEVLSLTKTTSIKWDWNAKFFDPIAADFVKICTPKLGAPDSAVSAVLVSAEELCKIFLTSSQSSDEARNAAQMWYAKLVQATGLEIKAAKFVFVDSFGGDDDVDITDEDLTDAEAMIKKLKSQTEKVEQEYEKFKKRGKGSESLFKKTMGKVKQIKALIELLQSYTDLDLEMIKQKIAKLKKMGKEFDELLKVLQEKIDEFLTSEDTADNKDEQSAKPTEDEKTMTQCKKIFEELDNKIEEFKTSKKFSLMKEICTRMGVIETLYATLKPSQQAAKEFINKKSQESKEKIDAILKGKSA